MIWPYVAAGCVTQPTIDIISSSPELPQCRINEVMGAALRNSGDYKEEEIVGILSDVDCTNIHQMCDINPRSIPPEIARWSNLIWFQCPLSKNDLLGFLRSASDNCAPGTYVCVGIITHEEFMYQYHLEHILGDNLDTCTLELNQYEFLGVDDLLRNKLLSYDYKHESKPLHHLVTLVFRLKYVHNSYFSWCTELRKDYEREHPYV